MASTEVVPTGSAEVLKVALPEASVPVPSEVFVEQALVGAAVEGHRARWGARGSRDGVGEGDRGAEARRVGRLVRTEEVPSDPRSRSE